MSDKHAKANKVVKAIMQWCLDKSDAAIAQACKVIPDNANKVEEVARHYARAKNYLRIAERLGAMPLRVVTDALAPASGEGGAGGTGGNDADGQGRGEGQSG